MNKVIAVLATLDTKGPEASYLREQLEALGSTAQLIDIGVVGEPMTAADVTREEVARAGGTPLDTLLEDPSRELAAPVMARRAATTPSRGPRRHLLVGRVPRM